MKRLPLLALLVLASPVQAQWLVVPKVEAQPLIAQVKRLTKALDFLGQPLSAEARKALEALEEDDGDEKVAAAVQKALDPLCCAAVEVGKDGTAKATASATKTKLVEQGWRAVLVKVVNKGGATGRLRADSPNARPVPGGPKDEVEKRWLGLLPYTGQPLLPNLSGLGLEYVLVQCYSRDRGEKTADITFRVEGGKVPAVREWRFAEGRDGWKADKNCAITADKGVLKVTMTGENPHISTAVKADKGWFAMRFWARFSKAGLGEVFWTTKAQPRYDGSRRRVFRFEASERGSEFEIRFDTMDELTGIRINPGNGPGTASFDWIALSQDGGATKGTAAVRVTFDAAPSIPVTFHVTDERGDPAMACFVIRGKADGHVYPAQPKRLAPDFFFHPQVYRATGETVRLPAGTYSVVCSRGPESVPEVKEIEVGDKPTSLRYAATRWVDPAKRNWWSGDHHIHAAGCQHYELPTEGVQPSDMMRQILGEDLKVGCCLTWGPCFDYQKRFFRAKPDPVSRYPYILRYDVEVSGFGSHVSGHLNLLRLKEQIPAGGKSKHHWPTLGMNTLRWAKKQGAVCGPAHSANGLTRTVGRVEGAKDGPNKLPSYDIPAYDGIGANEFIVQAALEVEGPDGKPVPAVDFISTMDTDRRTELNMWYHTLNCGFRVRASGETDFPCITGERVGWGRVYVKVDGKLDFDRWAQGIADGRSYVSDGFTHLMDFTAKAGDKSLELGVAGSEVKLDRPGKVKFAVRVAARYPGRKSAPVELVVNGLPVAKQEVACDGKERELTFEADIEASSWVAVRLFPGGHTNPFFVVVGGKPIRASRDSARWCLMGVDQCWKMKAKTYKKAEMKQAEEDYEAARKVYKAIVADSPK
jgi:hypothetical protein